MGFFLRCLSLTMHSILLKTMIEIGSRLRWAFLIFIFLAIDINVQSTKVNKLSWCDWSSGYKLENLLTLKPG
jgi:hypothetical protein